MCENAYRRFHRPEYIDPDPLVVVREQSVEDREAAAFLIAGLSLGRVQGILSVSRRLMAALGGRGKIRKTLVTSSPSDMQELISDITWRFFDPDSIADYCCALSAILRKWGSVEACFTEGVLESRNRISSTDFKSSPAILGLNRLRNELRQNVDRLHPMIFSDPFANGAQKRLHLCLRWLVRADNIDLGLWSCLQPSELWVPIDTHMLRHCRSLGLIDRDAADMKSVIAVTDAFRRIAPEDPVKYDFCLSRMGIHPEAAEHEKDFYGGNPG